MMAIKGYHYVNSGVKANAKLCCKDYAISCTGEELAGEIGGRPVYGAGWLTVH